MGALLDGVCAVFARHPDELKPLTGALRLTDTQSGRSWGFRLTEGAYAPLPDDAPADACILGKPEHLLAVLKRTLHPAKALLTGKVKVVGSKKLLIRLAEYL